MKDVDALFAFFAVLQADELSVRQILALASPFGITETNVRSALSRMHARNLITVRKTGRTARYRMGPRGGRIGSNVSRHFREPDWTGWDGSFWISAFSLPDSRSRHRVRKKLLAYRFRALYPGFWIRPFHPDERMEEPFREFLRMGGFDLFRGTSLGELSPKRMAELYDLHDTAGKIRKILSALRRSHRSIPSLSPEAVFIRWLRMGDVVVKTLVRDPLLPPKFLPPHWPAPELRRVFRRWNTLCAERSAPFVQAALYPSLRGD
jgi:DNA-binding transcriptional regulator PaaX